MPSEPSSIVRDPNRLAALQRTGLLDSSAEEAFDRLTRLAVKILRVPVALVSLVDHDRQFFKSCIGFAEPLASQRETPLSHSFCQHTIASQEPLLIEDARIHPLVHDNLSIPDLHVIAYAGIPLITADGHSIGSFCVIDTQPRAWTSEEVEILRELAASVLTEIELRLATAEAQAAVREREALLSIASHELKTPITAILGYAQLLERRLLIDSVVTERDLHAIRTIHTQGDRLNKMLGTLLDSTQFQTGQFTLNITSVDLKSLVARVIADLELSTVSHPIIYTPTDVSVVIQGDELRLDQVVHNLLGNAVKYSPDGGAITIEVTRDDYQAQLIVQDTGIGIPAASIPDLFQRFSRINRAMTANISGLGLGLYIVKEIVTLHGGTISVKSAEGEGSTFIVSLPIESVVAESSSLVSGSGPY